jgi:transcription elongation GreA/GreB family factor
MMNELLFLLLTKFDTNHNSMTDLSQISTSSLDATDLKLLALLQADASLNKVSYVSPLAKSLIGQKVGDNVTWLRPAGNLNLEILDIHYPS